MAKKDSDDNSFIKKLLALDVRGVNGLHIFMAYAKSASVKNMDLRISRLIAFLSWASSIEGFQWNAASIDRYSQHLASSGNAPSTISQKLSNLRQFLVAAHSANLIPQCVFYKKPGRKPKAQSTALSVYVPSPSSQPEPRVTDTPIYLDNSGFDRCALYHIFGIDWTFTLPELRRSYIKATSKYHPDVNKSPNAHEQFLVCKQSFDLLSDRSQKLMYEMFTKNKLDNPPSSLVSFVHHVQSVMSA